MNAEFANRRDFLSRMTTTAVAVGVGSLAIAGTAGAEVPDESAPFDDSWTARVTAARYRAVFDSPGIEEGLGLKHVSFYLEGFNQQFGATGEAIVPVLVIRHAATYLALNDAMWKKYTLGERSKTKDYATGADALRNPYLHVTAKAPIPAESSLESLAARRVVLLVCNKALTRYADEVAQATSQTGNAVHTEFLANLAPSFIPQPSGIYAVHRAQSVGCTFIKST
jgi:hypothetical protein